MDFFNCNFSVATLLFINYDIFGMTPICKIILILFIGVLCV